MAKIEKFVQIDLKVNGKPNYRFIVNYANAELTETSFVPNSVWQMKEVLEVNGCKTVYEKATRILAELFAYRTENEIIEVSGTNYH